MERTENQSLPKSWHERKTMKYERQNILCHPLLLSLLNESQFKYVFTTFNQKYYVYGSRFHNKNKIRNLFRIFWTEIYGKFYFCDNSGLPSAVKNCTSSNQTQVSVEVHCIAGYDGGLPQYFVLEMISAQTGRVR